MTKEEFAKNFYELPKGIQEEIVAKIRSGDAEEEEEVEEETEEEHNLRLKKLFESPRWKKGFEEKDVITTLTKNERDNYDKFKKEILQILFKYSKDSEDHLSLLSPLVDDILNGNVSKRDILKIVKDKK